MVAAAVARRQAGDHGSTRSWILLVLTTIGAALFSVFRIFRRFPLETLIFATVIAIAVAGVSSTSGSCYVIGWIVDFLSELGYAEIQGQGGPARLGTSR